MTTPDAPAKTDEFPLVVIALMKGVMYRDDNPPRWQSLLNLQTRLREYIAAMGLELILDEGEGYAFLRQRPPAPAEPELPRLIPRRQLGYSISLLLSLLRKKLLEFDAAGGETRLILSKEEIFDSVRLFLKETPNEARQMERTDSDIRKIVEMGFLHRLRGQEDRFEVRRILKSFVDAQWLGEFNQRLAEYREYAGVETSNLERPGHED